ncbi:MAG: ATP-binding protein [Chlamydiota bacterium]
MKFFKQSRFMTFFKKSKESFPIKEHSLLHFLEEGVCVVDEAYKGLECNSAFCRILSCKKEDFLNNFFFSIKSEGKEEVFDRCNSLLQGIQEGCSELRETLFYPGETASCCIELRAIRLNNQTRVLILKDTYQEYETLKIGKEFIANASHELRTPITIIKGFVETLKDLPEVSDAMLEDIFDKILRSCKRMDDIVKNLLILTDLDHLLKAKTEEFDLLDLLDYCQNSLLEQYPGVQIRVTHSLSGCVIQADPALLELAIMNLLHNAVKYSKAPATIELEVEVSSQVIIKVIDYGYGIAKENISYIFDRFYSVNKTLSRKLGGAGLGLSIVKTIIEKHQGKIVVESNPLGGTIFMIFLPKQVV